MPEYLVKIRDRAKLRHEVWVEADYPHLAPGKAIREKETDSEGFRMDMSPIWMGPIACFSPTLLRGKGKRELRLRVEVCVRDATGLMADQFFGRAHP